MDLPLGNFSRLSDEVILIILRNLEASDLINVSCTCRKLQRVCQEPELWVKIDDPPDNYGTLSRVVNQFANPRTTRLRIVSPVSPGGNKGYRSSLCPSLIEKLNIRTLSPKTGLSSLTQLYLIRQKFDGRSFRLQMLPKTLKLLHLSETDVEHVSETSHYFRGLAEHFTDLEELDLSYCSWVTGHSLMALSKFPSLIKLRLRGCRRVEECFAYVALASRFGFKTLKILDVTDTKVGSSEFTGMCCISTLEEFYFGQYDQYSDFEHNSINDICFAGVRSCQTLRILDISGSRVTNGVLPALFRLPNLVLVYAHFTQLTQEAIEEFERKKPECKIVKVSQTVATPPPPVAHQQPRYRHAAALEESFENAIELRLGPPP